MNDEIIALGTPPPDEVGVSTDKEITEAKKKGFEKCYNCTALRPLMDNACFPCVADYILNRNQEFSLLVSY